MSCTDKKYVVKEIVISSDTGLQGPVGPQGPPGPAGPVPDEYPADQVTLEGLPPYDNVQQALEALLYEEPVISDFTAGVNERENGQQVTALTFTWTLSKDVTSQTLTGPPEMTPVALTPEQRTVSVVLANLSSDATFTLQVDDGTTQVSSDWDIVFLNGNYVGDVNVPAQIDSAFILTLNKQLSATRSINYVTNAIGTQYNWYCTASANGTPTFFAGGLQVTYVLVDTISFTNAYGHVESYTVWRSEFPDIGPDVNIEVS